MNEARRLHRNAVIRASRRTQLDSGSAARAARKEQEARSAAEEQALHEIPDFCTSCGEVYDRHFLLGGGTCLTCAVLDGYVPTRYRGAPLRDPQAIRLRDLAEEVRQARHTGSVPEALMSEYVAAVQGQMQARRIPQEESR